MLCERRKKQEVLIQRRKEEEEQLHSKTHSESPELGGQRCCRYDELLED